MRASVADAWIEEEVEQVDEEGKRSRAKTNRATTPMTGMVARTRRRMKGSTGSVDHDGR
jgi:hypothetical protein